MLLSFLTDRFKNNVGGTSCARTRSQAQADTTNMLSVMRSGADSAAQRHVRVIKISVISFISARPLMTTTGHAKSA